MEDNYTGPLPDPAYRAPDTLAGLLSALEQDPTGCVLIAGGQSLLPGLGGLKNAPRLMLDVRRVRELNRLELTGDRLFLGAGVTLSQLLSSGIGTVLPALAKALGHVGNITIRNRATVGGCLAWADPRGELPLLFLLYEATVVTCRRHFSMENFIKGPYLTALAPGELIVGVEIARPLTPPPQGFLELMPRRSAGRAVVSVAALKNGATIRPAVNGLVNRPRCCLDLSANGGTGQWVDHLATRDPLLADPAYSAGYRTTVVKVLAERILEKLDDCQY